jgi:uncharacterized protein
MAKAAREFQVFTKPIGSVCNLNCAYCYYVQRESVHTRLEALRMPEALLENYILQHIEATPGPTISFSWHGGEPTLLGLEYFRRIVALQRKHLPRGKRLFNGMQTNGILVDEEWCRFLSIEGFSVGLSLDGPPDLHNRYRVTRGGEPTHSQALRAFQNLRRSGVPCDILCAVHDQNVLHPLQVYRYFREIGARHIGFLPIVERNPDSFEELACGDIPVIECNGDFFSCDHFVDDQHRIGNILETPFERLLESGQQKAFGQAKRNTLPRFCLRCDALDMCNGGCPKDRFLMTPDGEPGLNYLCFGFKRFFAHCRPFFLKVIELARAREARRTEPGRNDPCPCGSGLKFKRCCLLKKKTGDRRQETE